MLNEGNFDEAREMAAKEESVMSRILNLGLARQGAVRRREDGEVAIVDAGPRLKGTWLVEFTAPIYAAPVAANGVLYICTQTHLYAFEDKEPARAFFTRLIDLYRNWNYAAEDTPDYQRYLQQLRDLAEEHRRGDAPAVDGKTGGHDRGPAAKTV